MAKEYLKVGFALTKCVTGDALFDGGFLGGVFDGALEARWVEVMAASSTPIPAFPHFKSRNGGRRDLTPSPSPGRRGG